MSGTLYARGNMNFGTSSVSILDSELYPQRHEQTKKSGLKKLHEQPSSGLLVYFIKLTFITLQ